jgi:hypothetical protein
MGLSAASVANRKDQGKQGSDPFSFAEALRCLLAVLPRYTDSTSDVRPRVLLEKCMS